MAISKWDDVSEKLILIEGWARDGLTDEQIAKNLGICKDTFYKYKKEHTDFSDALKRGKEVVDYEVENALLKRALGYTFEEVTKEPIKDPDTGATQLVVTKRVRKEVPADTTAQIFWLKNRKPKVWRDKQNINITSEIEEMSEEEINKRIAELECSENKD